MSSLFSKILSVGVSKLSPEIKEWLQKILTKCLDFFEKHFNNIVKHMFGIGGAGLGLGLLKNMADIVIDGATERFSFFSNILGLNVLFTNLSSTLTPYMTHWNCTFIQAFSAFGCVSAINTIINSCAYALLFWLCVVVFKWMLGLLPLLLNKLS